MAKNLITEQKLGKLLSFITGAIIGGKTDAVTSKVSQDKELVKRLKAANKSYSEMIKYLEKKYGKDFVRSAKEKSDKVLRQQGFDI